MQVAGSKLDQFKSRITCRFKGSDAYRGLRSDRQREGSVAVLGFICNHGYGPVRRCALRRAFTVCGSERHGVELEKPLTDHELQRILNRLVDAGIVERSCACAKSKRIKRKRKKEVYYGIPVSSVDFNELVDEGDLEAELETLAAPYREAERSGLEDRILLDRLRKVLIKDFLEILEDDEAMKKHYKSMGAFFISRYSSEEEKRRDQYFAIKRWAELLPDSERHLRTHALNWLNKKRREDEVFGRSP